MGWQAPCQTVQMTPKLCTHGIWQRDKFGTQQQGELEICKGCGLPTQDSYRKAAAKGPVETPLTPRDRARAAREQGLRYFEIQLQVGESTRDVRIFEADSGGRSEQDNSHVLHEIEAEGWELHTAGYVFVPTGQSSRMKVLGTGESVAISGVTVGVYLFRSVSQSI